MMTGAEAERVGIKSNGRGGRLVVLAATLTVIVAVGALMGIASGRTFNWGNNVVVGPKYSGPVAVSPGCIATARAGKVTLPYRAGGPNQLSSVLGWVFIPRI